VLHSTVDWAQGNLEATKEYVANELIDEAQRMTGVTMPSRSSAKAHRWLYARPAESLPEAFLWDEGHLLGACGDWCGGPRVEGALKSGMALAGRVLGSIQERSIPEVVQRESKQLSLFSEEAR
jgi:predicted NAD/FAD-dependent oxidoreductase